MIFSLVSSIATSVGIGGKIIIIFSGGGVYSSLLMLIEKLPPAEAYPIAIFLIAICSLCTFYMGVKDKQNNPNASFVNYDLAIILSPTLLVGTKIGTIFNKMLSPVLLTLALAAFIIQNIIKMHKKAKDLREKELKQIKTDTRENEPKYNLMKDDIQFSPRKIPRKLSHTLEVEREIEMNSTMMVERILEEEKNPLRIDRIKFLGLLLLISLIDQILEGNAKVPSLIGVARCSGTYWLLFMIYIGVSIYLVKYSCQVVRINYEYNLSVSKELKNEQFENIDKNYIKIVIYSLLAGIIASSLGIGGGMVVTPLFLEMGIDAKAATATSNVLIIMTSIAGSLIFLFSGQLNFSFAFYMAIPCSIAALYGSKLINEMINRTKRPSILLFLMLYFLVASVFILMINSYNKLSNDYNSPNGLNVFHLNNFCT